jgi:hypothetical protein
MKHISVAERVAIAVTLSVLFSAGTPAILTEVLRGFIHSPSNQMPG